VRGTKQDERSAFIFGTGFARPGPSVAGGDADIRIDATGIHLPSPDSLSALSWAGVCGATVDGALFGFCPSLAVHWF